MTVRRCRSCGAFSVHPPATFDLQASVLCSACGENHGSWRAVERAEAASESEAARPSSDLRAAKRTRSLLGGKVVFNGRSSSLDCTLRDLSATGAKLYFSAHVPIPEEFVLEVPQKGRTHRARIMWRTADSCGVRFIGE
jgi:hypothetical protein